MATYSQRFHHYPEQQQFILPDAFNFGHYDEREKTPTDSLLNHTGLSPLPLTATPPLSRHPSHQPEPPPAQAPEQLLWDDGSFSDSPTSVRTPEGELFEVEMLDSEPSMQTFYHQGASGMSTQASHNTITAADSTALFTPDGNFSNHIIDATFTQVQQYNQHYQGQTVHPNTFQVASTHDHGFGGNYTIQPHRQEPWNGQGPSRSSTTPRSGGVIFDAVTDPAYSDHMNVENWTMNFTDPTFMISPSEATVPHDNFFQQQQQQQQQHQHQHQHQHLVHRPHVHIPPTNIHQPHQVQLEFTKASPPPDNHGFVNYNANSEIFTSSYITPGQYSPSSPGNSSNGNYPQSPFQPTISPVAVSPSSDGQFSFRHDTEMMLDPFPAQQQFHQMPQIQSAALNMNFAPARGPEISFSHTPEPDISHQGGATVKITGKQSGGRALGTHLEPTVAKAAHDMRKITACWHCVLQRDRCGPGDICDRCLKRSQRPNADCGLGCSRIKLVDLSAYFLPALVTQMHEDSHLKHFVSQHIHQWGNVEITVYMTCGQYTMPRIPVKVYEFVPKGNELLVQIQYITDAQTNKRIAVPKQSPALGMVHINHNEEKTYDKYISDIVDHHLDDFGELCWKEDDNDFLQKLFKLMTRVKPKSDEEAKLLREVFRLVVVTFIMSHTLTIVEQGKHETLSRMHSYAGPNSYYDNFTSPRMTNRQLKYFFSRLQRSIQTTVLNKLQQIFKSSKGCDKWLAAFVAVLGLCMALEDQQKTIHLVMSTRATSEGSDPRDAQAQADIACQEIDTRVHFVQQIFRWKYNRKHNPLVNADHDWEKEVGFGDAASVGFVRQVAQLVRENTDFLQQQQRVSISYANQTKYSSRLVGQFLLSFWLPNA